MFLVSKSKYQRVCYIVRNAHTTIPKMKARFLITSEKETCGMAPTGVSPGDAAQGSVLRGRLRAGLGPEATSLLGGRGCAEGKGGTGAAPLPAVLGASLCPPRCSGAPSFPGTELRKLQIGLVTPLPRVQTPSWHQSREWRPGDTPRRRPSWQPSLFHET